MRHDEFIGQVQHRARLSSRGDAERACRATLETLGERIPAGLADNIAAQLPHEIGGHLRRTVARSGGGERFGRADFVTRVAERAGVGENQAGYIAHAVTDVLFAATEGGLMARVSDSLPPDLREYVGPVTAPGETVPVLPSASTPDTQEIPGQPGARSPLRGTASGTPGGASDGDPDASDTQPLPRPGRRTPPGERGDE